VIARPVQVPVDLIVTGISFRSAMFARGIIPVAVKAGSRIMGGAIRGLAQAGSRRRRRLIMAGRAPNAGRRAQRRGRRAQRRGRILKTVGGALGGAITAAASVVPRNSAAGNVLTVAQGLTAPEAQGVLVENTVPAASPQTGEENIGTMTSGTTTNKGFCIQITELLSPTNLGLAVRLATIATQYQEFTIARLVIKYVPVAPTSTVGNVMLAVIPDPSAASPTSLDEAMAIPGVVCTPVWQAADLVIPDELLDKFGTYTAESLANPEPRLECGGRLLLMTSGTSGDSTTIGRCSISYCLELGTPILNEDGTTATAQMHLRGGRLSVIGRRIVRPPYDVTYQLRKAHPCPATAFIFWTPGEIHTGPPTFQCSNDVTVTGSATFAGDTHQLSVYEFPAGRYDIRLVVPDGITIVRVMMTAHPRAVPFFPSDGPDSLTHISF